MWAMYALAAVGATVLDIRRAGFKLTHLLLPFVFLTLHVAYGVGTVIGLAEMPFFVKKIKGGENKNG